jgi:hypothetical protein
MIKAILSQWQRYGYGLVTEYPPAFHGLVMVGWHTDIKLINK